MLRAVTLKKYSLSMSRSGTVYDVCAGFRSATFFQAVRRLSRTSRRYPVRSRPPSLSGGFQETLAVFSVTSETDRGPTGVDGLPTSSKTILYRTQLGEKIKSDNMLDEIIFFCPAKINKFIS